MRRRALVWTVATLGVVAIVGLFAALSLLFSSPTPVYAQSPANSAPEFTEDTTATRSVAENTPAYTDIGVPVTATDSDTDDRLTYSIKNARTSPFTIVRATGQLQVGQPLDHEAKSSYTVTVQVTDSEDADGNFENPAGIDDTITVTITVNNVEEPGKVSLSWTRPQVDAEITAKLTDPDIVDGTPTWQWAKSSNKSNWDDISGETSASYTPVTGDGYLRATASYDDSKSSGKTAQAVNITLVIADPDPDNNKPPAFNSDHGSTYHCGRHNFGSETADYCLNISRSTPAGDDLYYPRYVTDDDHHELRYSLGGTNAGLFKIDPSSTTTTRLGWWLHPVFTAGGAASFVGTPGPFVA